MLRLYYGENDFVREGRKLSSGSNATRENRGRSIAVLVFCAVNLPLLLAAAVLLPYDYHRQLSNSIQAKQTSLDAQASTIFQGLSIHSADYTQDSIQDFIDTACSGLHESKLLDQHITVRWNGMLLLAKEHVHEESQKLVKAMQLADSSVSRSPTTSNSSMIIGSYSTDGLGVYISETTASLRHSLWQDMLVHIGFLTVLGLTAVAIVNTVLWRIIIRPIRRISADVSQIASGHYELAKTGYQSREVETLAGAIRQMSQSLAANEQTQRAQMERAKRIQEHLLPVGVKVPGLTTACVFQPAETVAGDYYDLIDLKDGTWLICVADVTGHGVPAAMGSAMLKALLLHAIEHHQDPQQILHFINSKLPELLPEEFITMFLCRWDNESRLLTFANAGHEPGLLLSDNGNVTELFASDLPLGVAPTGDWKNESFQLMKGQRLLLTTDGVAEALDPNNKLFGRRRLTAMLRNGKDQTPHDFIASIRDAVCAHQLGQRSIDDVTILALECETTNDMQRAG